MGACVCVCKINSKSQAARKPGTSLLPRAVAWSYMCACRPGSRAGMERGGQAIHLTRIVGPKTL